MQAYTQLMYRTFLSTKLSGSLTHAWYGRNKEKGEALGQLFERFNESLESTGAFPPLGDAEASPAKPQAQVWTMYQLAQHYDMQGRTGEQYAPLHLHPFTHTPSLTPNIYTCQFTPLDMHPLIGTHGFAPVSLHLLNLRPLIRTWWILASCKLIVVSYVHLSLCPMSTNHCVPCPMYNANFN